jgi:hypothetical protein
MTTAKEYCTHAKRCFVRAQETDSEELRQASLAMASYWMDAAMRTECLGDSRDEPEQRAVDNSAKAKAAELRSAAKA